MDEKELRAIISLLNDTDAEVVGHVEEKILGIGKAAIPLMEEMWSEVRQADLQRKIEDITHKIQFSHLKNELLHWSENEHDNLTKGLWLIATYQYPSLEYQHITQQLDDIYYKVWTDFKDGLHPFDQVKIINNILFNQLKFGPNNKKFHSPSNSMINVVLETKKGNPISLAVIYMYIAQKLGLPVYGVNLPNLFMLTYKTDQITFYINAFNKGLIFSKSDIDHYIEQLHINPNKIFYEPCDNKDIVIRSLRNLTIAFEKLDEFVKSDETKQLLHLVESSKD